MRIPLITMKFTAQNAEKYQKMITAQAQGNPYSSYWIRPDYWKGEGNTFLTRSQDIQPFDKNYPSILPDFQEVEAVDFEEPDKDQLELLIELLKDSGKSWHYDDNNDVLIIEKENK